ncbi:MAG: hypothetical protein ACO3N7_11515, partial [Kiritimatiellia bacterium]
MKVIEVQLGKNVSCPSCKSNFTVPLPPGYAQPLKVKKSRRFKGLQVLAIGLFTLLILRLVLTTPDTTPRKRTSADRVAELSVYGSEFGITIHNVGSPEATGKKLEARLNGVSTQSNHRAVFIMPDVGNSATIPYKNFIRGKDNSRFDNT